MLTRDNVLALVLSTCALTLPGCSDFSSDNSHGGCGTVFFAHDKEAKQCRPVAACTPGGDQAAHWDDCIDPCATLDQATCVRDVRCQRVYEERQASDATCSSAADCNQMAFAGCHPLPAPRACEEETSLSCTSSACRPVTTCTCTLPVPNPLAQVSCGIGDCDLGGATPLGSDRCAPRSCMALGPSDCQQRTDCAWDGVDCGPVHDQPCGALTEGACGVRRDCRMVGTVGYRPIGMKAAEPPGTFMRCEDDSPKENGCDSNSDCPPSEQCVGAGAGAGRCEMVSGCGGLDEELCSGRPGCAPKFSETCARAASTAQPYYGSGGLTTSTCTPVEAFAGCVQLDGDEIVPDRSLFIQDPGVLAEPELQFPALMRALGQNNVTTMELFGMYAAAGTINGRTVAARPGMTTLINDAKRGTDFMSALGFRPVAISNRIDLVSGASCGEARIVYANDQGATSPVRRMTMIFEFGVPLDGAGCRTWALRWAQLSRLATRSPQFHAALLLLTRELFTAERLNQLRSNELMNVPLSTSPVWELREFALVEGRFRPQPCKNSPDPSVVQSPAFLAWLDAHQSEVAAGTAVVPTEFLAGSSLTTPGFHLTLPQQYGTLEAPLNKNSCTGCHTDSTQTKFVHVGERLFANLRPLRSAFLREQLAVRGEVLRTLLGDGVQARVLRTRPKPATH